MSEIELYRGDSRHIDTFNLDSTSHSLFGYGIYLTSSAEVASDYTFKGLDKETITFEAEDTRAAVAHYLQHLVDTQTDWQKVRTDIRYNLSGQLYDDPEYRDPDKVEATRNKYEKLLRNTVKAEASKYLKKAKALYSERKNSLSVTRKTTGEYVFTSIADIGSLSTFNLPTSYVSNMLHGDRPLPDDALKAVKSVLTHKFGDIFLDLRDKEGEFQRFDDWIEIVKSQGTYYAWRDDEVFGGKGENPTLDQVWNGTHGGFSILYDRSNQEMLARLLQELGYNGITYDGGVRVMGNHVRGGGGVRHDAYLFWDADFINSRRTGATPMTRNPIDEKHESTLRNGSPGLRMF